MVKCLQDHTNEFPRGTLESHLDGDDFDWNVSKEAAARVVEANPSVRLVQLEGADHNIRRTRFDGYLPALKNFLREIYSS